MNSVIDIKNISKEYKWEKKHKGFWGIIKDMLKPQYKSKLALDDVSVTIQEGDIVGLLGPNGAGKSTLFKCMTGILKVDKGSVCVLGKEAWEERKSIIPFIGSFFGSKGLMWWNLPVIKSYELMRDLYKIPEDEFQECLAFFVEIIGDKEYLDKPPRQLSYGQRQRAEIVTALLHNPKIVFLDEPTLGMDIVAKEKLSQIILECNRVYNTTFIISTHDLKDIEKMCSRIIIINKGKLVKDSNANHIKDELMRKCVLQIDFKDEIIIQNFSNLNVKIRVITKNRIEIDVDAQEIPIYKLLEHINNISEIATFKIDYETIEDIIKKYYV